MADKDSIAKEPKTTTSTPELGDGSHLALDVIQGYQVRLFLKHGGVLSNLTLECKSCVSRRGKRRAHFI